ncbi:5'-3' exonuclease [Mycoplasmopsis columbina]|uniref:5'-3' exonuclease n=1 Tax=Mycoplasmopsis columbina SF7 TaxID=1037410 RepID=F9UJU5_9BACT|nr:5'-3' exonuclease [Mycoplasmopsis columbina]EGV00291.1 DNA-directed DNA polymerase [Mycoplasmopsis columbina SF7]VEU76845.1 DNA polymerase I [Mycoplasmopsis columbina]
MKTNNAKKENFLLIDGNLLMFQSFYASYNPNNINYLMKSPKGIYVNGVHVFLISLAKLIEAFDPKYLFIAFDANGKTKRHNEFEGYKSGRNKAPEIIFEQFALIKDILTGLNIKWFEQIGDEADDLIATLAKTKETNNIIFSKDKDLLQLVNENTIIAQNAKNEYGYRIVNLDNFETIFGILPSQIPDFKGLAGDASDNLTGVNGIGDKGAVKLLNEFGSLENIYQNIEQIKGKQKEKLLNDKNNAFLCKKLALLNKDVDMDTNIKNYEHFLYTNNEKGKELLKEHKLTKCYEYIFNRY